MPNATPIFTAFNAGPFSELMQGRVDFARFRASLKSSSNVVPTVQGPMLSRSGTRMFVPVFDESKKSTLIPFEYSDTGILMLEFAENAIRVLDDNGLVAHAAETVTAVNDDMGHLQITVPGHSASVDDQYVLLGFEGDNGVNGQVVKITSIASDALTTDFPYLTGGLSLVSAQAAKVFTITSTYSEAQLPSIRPLQRNNVMWLFCEGKRNFTLARNGELDWTLAEVEYLDGPYKEKNATGTTLTVTGTGNAVPVMTGVSAPSGTASGQGGTAWHAMNDDTANYWQSNQSQTGHLQYQFAAPTVVDGYSIHIPQINNNGTYLAEDYAPRRWRFEGSTDNVNWDLLHAQTAYTDWSNGRSAYFSFPNTTAYTYYRIDIDKVQVQGAVTPRIGKFVLSSPTTRSVTIDASAATGINGGQGFLTTDVGRVLRIQGNDLYWRWMRVTARNSATQITADVFDDPFSTQDVKTTQWRLGLYSDTTGWPTYGKFSDKRLWLAGQEEDEDLVAGSFVDKPFSHSPTDPDGVTTDEHAIVVPLDADKRPSIAWLAEDERGLIVGSLAGARVLTPVDNTSAASQTNVRWRPSVARKAAKSEPISIDRQHVYIARGRKVLRELSYVFEADGFKSPSMTTYASHLTKNGLQKMAYAEEPYTVLWFYDGVGKLLGFTYNRDEDVLAWHEHTIAVDGEVEDVAASYRTDISEDALWMIVKKTINGQVRRYIVRAEPTWRDGSTLDDAWFVDLGLRYTGAATKEIYGIRHLVGETVYCLADKKVQGPFTVDTDGHITLDNEASDVIVGIGIHSWAELPRLEAASPDGTAQAKLKSVGDTCFYVWDSIGGRFGLKDKPDDLEEFNFRDPTVHGLSGVVPLYTGFTEPKTFPHSINREGHIYVEQPAHLPLPLNVVACVPFVQTTAV